MWCIGRNIEGLACSHNRFPAAERGLHLTFQKDKGLLEVMPMGRRASTGRNMHIDDAKSSVGLLSSNGDGVGIADHTDVRKVDRVDGPA